MLMVMLAESEEHPTGVQRATSQQEAGPSTGGENLCVIMFIWAGMH